MVAVVIPVVMVQLRLFFLDAFEILLGDGFEELLVVGSTATLYSTNFNQHQYEIELRFVKKSCCMCKCV